MGDIVKLKNIAEELQVFIKNKLNMDINEIKVKINDILTELNKNKLEESKIDKLRVQLRLSLNAIANNDKRSLQTFLKDIITQINEL